MAGTLEGGSEVTADLAQVRIVAPEAALTVSWPQSSGPRVAICMATYNPPVDLLNKQIDSIRGQTHGNWVCVISDDGSSAEGYASLQEAIGDDARFFLSRSPKRLGFYHN